MEAAIPAAKQKQSSSYRERWRARSGERLYILIRWLLLVPLFVVVHITTPVWPISSTSDYLVLALWAYAAFSLLMTCMLLLPLAALDSLLRNSYFGDIVFLALLTFFSGAYALDFSLTFFPFFFLPLMCAAIHHKPLASLGIGVATAFIYGADFVVARGVETASYTLMGVDMLTLVVVPWLASSLKEKWSAHNLQHVVAAEQETQLYRERMQSFFTVSAALADTMNYKHVLDATLRELQILAPYNVGVVMFPTNRPRELKIEAIEPTSPGDIGLTFIVGEGSIAQMLRASSSPSLVENISQEPDLAEVSVLRSCTAACIVPLRMKLRTFGVLVVASEQPASYTQEHLAIINSLANYVIVALYNAQMQFDLKQGQGKLLAKEKEVRDRIASKLHDGPTQKVAQIMMNTDFLKKVAEHDPSRLVEEVNKFAELARVANGEMRMTLFELRPMTLETEGLRAALNDYVEKMKIRCGSTRLVVKSRGLIDSALEREVEGVIFDIIQESVNNALKHAEASNILIGLGRKDKMFEVIIQDDGKGFDPVAAKQAAAKRASFGLHNFDERAQMIEGTIEIESEPGKGSKITILAPLADATA